MFTGDVSVEDEIEHGLLSEAKTAWAQREWSIQHVLFPAMRLFFKPQASLATNGTFVKVKIYFCSDTHFMLIVCVKFFPLESSSWAMICYM